MQFRSGVPLASVFTLVSGLSLAPSAVDAGADDPFPEADSVAEIGLARVAEEAGDARILASLREPLPRQRALIAVRASPYTHAPEVLLMPLAKLACGRDPDLSFEAAHACSLIAGQLSAGELGAREVLKSDLRDARASLQCGASEPIPRADVSALLAQTSAVLDVLLR